ncbi:ComEC/Rec2 family competence protein [Cellulomonas dongxiuzhuiae]|uniref:ComEC/Rec2 family competence protein n=1 Tax=Cellulomonas dongxiuzhuiae TaxID=2819979 RepID=UPI001AAEB11D|nr:ComEC/Rec2 family competence protein [Cellulomonas dongxiuzhuiae]MBO3086814.1 ComEC/Rec2 family competence protein [Cellulomonas dongxiuzhuiae]
MSGGPGATSAAADLRLVPPAVAAWCAALVVVQAPHVVAWLAPVAGALITSGAVVVMVAGVRHARDRAGEPGRPGALPGPRAGARQRALPAVVLGTATALVVLVSGAAAQQVRAPDVLLAAADDGGTVEVVGRVTVAPRQAGSDAGPRVVLTVTTSAVRVDGTWRRARAPVEVAAPAGAVLDAVVHVRGVAARTMRAGRAAVRVQAREAPVVTVPPRAAHTWAARVRLGARDVARPLPPDVRGLLPAVTVGDTDGVPDDLVLAMRAAGLAHVMAVSGAHFAILGTLVLAAAAAVGAPAPVRVAAAATAGAALLLVVGPEPSVVRAAVMGGVGLVGLLAGRRATGSAALSAAVVALLVADPWLAVDVGFCLSVAATAGLVVLGGPLVERWSARCGRDAAAMLAAPVAAQLGCLPVTLALWPTLGPWSVVANVAVVPAVAPATVLGLLAALLASPCPVLADLVAAGAGACCWWIAAVARWAAGLPGAALAWWPGVGGAVTATLVALAAAALALGRPRRT